MIESFSCFEPLQGCIFAGFNFALQRSVLPKTKIEDNTAAPEHAPSHSHSGNDPEKSLA
jgi:hypothetical protein